MYSGMLDTKKQKKKNYVPICGDNIFNKNKFISKQFYNNPIYRIEIIRISDTEPLSVKS